MDLVLYLIFNAIRAYAIGIYTGTFLGSFRRPHLRRKLTDALYYAACLLLWLTVRNAAAYLPVHALLIFLMTLQYQTAWKKRLICTVWGCAAGMLIDRLTFVLFRGHAAILYRLIRDIAALLLAFVFRSLSSRVERRTLRTRYSLYLILISVSTMLIGMLTVKSDSMRDSLIAIGLLVINFLNFYIYSLEQRNLEAEHQLQMIAFSNRTYRNQLQIMADSQKKLRFIRHDMQKHLLRIREMAAGGRSGDIPLYLDAMEQAIIVPQEYARTGNRDVDSIINYELTRAAELGAELTCDCSLPEQIAVTSFDMTAILGNLLSNAIAALLHCGEKKLAVSVRSKRGIICIDLRNSYDPNDRRTPDGKEHGLGLSIVRSTLEKYHGTLKTSSDGHEFHASAVFFSDPGEELRTARPRSRFPEDGEMQAAAAGNESIIPQSKQADTSL